MFASTGNIRKFSVKEGENPAFSVFLREILPGFNVCLMEIPGNMRYNVNEIEKEGIIMSEENNTPEKTHDAELPDGSYFYQDDQGLLLCGKAYRLKDGIMEQLTDTDDVLDMALLD